MLTLYIAMGENITDTPISPNPPLGGLGGALTIYSWQHLANLNRISLHIFSENMTAFCRLELTSTYTIIDNILSITLDYGIPLQEFDSILSLVLPLY